MPRVRLRDPWGVQFGIDTRSMDVLRAWFDDILPIVNAHYGSRRTPAADISVEPMYASGVNDSCDWLTDHSVIGGRYLFTAMDGAAGMLELEQLRERLQDELDARRAERGY